MTIGHGGGIVDLAAAGVGVGLQVGAAGLTAGGLHDGEFVGCALYGAA